MEFKPRAYCVRNLTAVLFRPVSGAAGFIGFDIPMEYLMVSSRHAAGFAVNIHRMSGHEAEQFRPVALHPLPFDSNPVSGYDRACLNMPVHLPLWLHTKSSPSDSGAQQGRFPSQKPARP